MSDLIFIVPIAAVAFFIIERVLLGLARLFGFYVINNEKEARVFVLFGDIIGTVQEPGLHLLWPILGWRAILVNILGTSYTRSMTLDQQYIRSIPVNSEEGTPMGIGVW
jgi:regulator of protease activity HflC (stomatin/prohibitin superfamily)